MSAPDQRHIQNAFAFELSKIETPAISRRMLGHLALVDETLAHAVETAMDMEGEGREITPYQAPVDLGPSPALSLVGKAKPTLKGRKIGALVTDGADGDRLESLRDALDKEEAELAIVAPKLGAVRLKSGKHLPADLALSGPLPFSLMQWRCLHRRERLSRFSRTRLRSTGFETRSGISRLSGTRQRRSPYSRRPALRTISTQP
jgi:catalase-related immune-responsive protein